MLSHVLTYTPTDNPVTREFSVTASDINSLKKAAQDFEASYISQMLTFSGLDKALTMGGGDDMSAFASFYIESLAEKISESGGFGLAEKLYESMIRGSELGLGDNAEGLRVDLGKL